MACYILKCKCGKMVEKICSYDKAKAFECECGEIMEISPVKSLFKIYGFSADNGYHRSEESYDGVHREW